MRLPCQRRALPLLGLMALIPWNSAFGYEITGTVKDRMGNPVSDVSLWLCRDHEVMRTSTANDGSYRFSNASPGPTSIVGHKSGFSLTGADVHVLGDMEIPLVLVDAVTVKLRFIDEKFDPVAGAVIRLLYIADTFTVPVADLVDHGFPPLRTNDTGFLPLPGMPKGSYFAFVAYRTRYAETRVPYMPVRDDLQTFQLYPGHAVRGRVLSPEGKGVERARVEVYASADEKRYPYTERLCDKEGYYVVYVAPGDYVLVAKHPDYAAAAPVRVSVAAGDDEHVVDCRLLEPRHIAGTVLTPDGAPAVGVLMRYLVDKDIFVDQLTRHDGSFDITIPPGEGALRVLPGPGYTTEHFGDIRVTLDTSLRADLAPIRLRALPAVEGQVLAADGTPQPGVLVSTRDTKPPQWVITDADGRFKVQLTEMTEDGKASLRAEHALRFLRKDFEVDLKNSEPASIVLEEFEPDLERPQVAPGQNDLTTLLDDDAPEISTDVWFNGAEVRLAALRGKVVVMTFWGGFDETGPGRDRMEELRALHTLLKDVEDVVFLGIHDNGSEESEIRKYITDYRIPFLVGRDTEDFATFQRYLINVIPQTVLIDKQSKVRYFQVDGRLLELIKSLRREGE